MPVRVVTIGGITVVITTTFHMTPEHGLEEHITVTVPKKMDQSTLARLAVMKDSEAGKNPYTGETSRNALPDFPILDAAF